jgi:putative sterol carrier protein
MADATAAFFDELARRGREPLLGNAVGSVRFELAGDSQIETWRVSLDHGDVVVSRDKGDADCVVRVERKLFNALASGEVNAMAALLRGAVAFEGDLELLVRLQRIFPPPTVRGVVGHGADLR